MHKTKKEYTLILLLTLVLLILKWTNVFKLINVQEEYLFIFLLIICCAYIVVYIQQQIDANYQKGEISYRNLDVLKYICSILIIILHLRPFLNFSGELDLLFNNIITRICVPVFFAINGYFVATKENERPGYIKFYNKRMIQIYLIWSAIYVAVILCSAKDFWAMIEQYTTAFDFSSPLMWIVFVPVAIIVALLYSGVYYHLWYFPALIISLWIIRLFTKKFKLKYLYIIAFGLLLLGATETYYGILPTFVQNIVDSYYDIFVTSRNFLFFGLFYVVMGFSIGLRKDIFRKYCFEKLIASLILLVLEANFLKDTYRLNSNILLSCIPLTYYLFISTLYLSHVKILNIKFPFRDLSKYYYFIHPAVIVLCSTVFKINNVDTNPYLQVVVVLLITHLISLLIIQIKKKHKLPI